MMKKMMNKFFTLTIIIGMILSMIPTKVHAETLRDVKNNLAKLQSEQAENNQLSTDAKNKINAKRNSILSANNTITQNEKKVEDAKVQVAESKESIKIKEQEIKDVLVTLQYTKLNEKEYYTDYVFSSSTISDMMERQAIVEQVIKYTQKELEDLNTLIVEKEKLQVKLADDNVALEKSITEYEKQIQELESLINKYASVGLSYEEKIKAIKSNIKTYQDAGCKDNDDLDDCYNNKKINSAAFSRPLDSGRITQAWSARHGGIDIGGNKPGTNVYAPANGTVIYVAYKTSCGGNIIYMHSTVGGQKYTIEFAHLRSMNVKSGQYVTKGTVIGAVGGDSSTWYYDSCTTGAHLHYGISYGYYFNASGRSNWSTYKANTGATAVQKISNLNSKYGWKFTTRG